MARKLRGNTTLEMIRSGESERNSFRPIGTNTTISSQTSNPAMMNQSYNKMIGGGSGEFGAAVPSMDSLEAASMRLADAASRRNIAEREAEYDLEARQFGFRNIGEMQMDMERKRREEDRKRREEDRKKQESRPYTIDRRGRRVYQ